MVVYNHVPEMLSFDWLPTITCQKFKPVIGCFSPGPYDKDSQWTEESIRSCLHLFLALLPLKPRMIHGLAEVYR